MTMYRIVYSDGYAGAPLTWTKTLSVIRWRLLQNGFGFPYAYWSRNVRPVRVVGAELVRCHMPSPVVKALVDDPAWVLRMYCEAKEILTDIQEDVQLPVDISLGVGDWLATTAMDTCTTCGIDCACNTEPTYATDAKRIWRCAACDQDIPRAIDPETHAPDCEGGRL